MSRADREHAQEASDRTEAETRPGNSDAPRGRRSRARRLLSALRVSGYNAFTALLFLGGGIVLQVTTAWPMSFLLIITGALQYVAAVVIRASGAGDVLRITFFETADERDRDIRRKATALVGDVAIFVSLVAFIISIFLLGPVHLLTVYLAVQTCALTLLWILATVVLARRG